MFNLFFGIWLWEAKFYKFNGILTSVYIEDITWPRVDMNFIFECWTRCRVEHEKIKFISTSGHVIFCLLHKHTNDWRFSEDFRPVSEDFQRFSQIFPKVRRTFPNIFRTFSEDNRRFPKISEKAPMMFRSYSNISKYALRDCVTIAIVIMLVTMATPISSHVKDKNSTFTAWDEDMIF